MIMFRVKICSSNRYPVARKIIRKTVDDILVANRLNSSDVEISVAVVGDRKMRQLARDFLSDEARHAVLAFPFESEPREHWGFVNYPDGRLRLGEIVLCWPDLLAAAAGDNVSVDEETRRLTAHAILHLLGLKTLNT